MKWLSAVAIAASLGPAAAQDQPAGALLIKHTDREAPAIGAAANFTGEVLVTRPFQAQAPGRAAGAFVTFRPGARTAWHTHPLGQTLIVIDGEGRVQQSGGPLQVMQVGDVVWIPPGVKHWHGAAPEASMTHVAIAEHAESNSVQWLEPVSQAQYRADVATVGGSE